jgi:hypothetical protein
MSVSRLLRRERGRRRADGASNSRVSLPLWSSTSSLVDASVAPAMAVYLEVAIASR